MTSHSCHSYSMPATNHNPLLCHQEKLQGAAHALRHDTKPQTPGHTIPTGELHMEGGIMVEKDQDEGCSHEDKPVEGKAIRLH